MESLMESLLGKDETYVLEKLQSLMKNEEKVKAQEETIKKLESEVDESKEEIHYFKNKLDHKRKVLDDMEYDLEMYERKNEDAKEELESKERELNDLVKFITGQVEEIAILRDNNQSMVSQIGENIRMEKKLDVQEKEMKELQEKLKDEMNNGKQELVKDRDRLLEEVEKLREENEHKESILKNLDDEYKEVRKNLNELETKNAKLNDVGNKLEMDTEESIPLTVELKSKTLYLHSTFKCVKCDYYFQTKCSLLNHIKMEHESKVKELLTRSLEELNQKIEQQRLEVTEKLFDLKDKESIEKQSCRCKGKCIINHYRYNWKKDASKMLHSKQKNFKNIAIDDAINEESEPFMLKKLSCNPWGLNFFD